MKKIIYILALLLSVSSCKKGLLDTTPINQKGISDFYKTPDDAFQALVAAYSVLDWSGFGNITLTSEIASDNCFGGAGTGDSNVRQWDRFESLTDHNADAWTKYYTGIYRVNVLLQNIDKVDFGTNTALKTRYIAEAHFLRAYFYFDLVRMFGNVVLLTTPVEPGKYSQPQANPDDVYKLIATDLKSAATDLAATPYASIPAAEYGRATKWAAESLLGRVFLYYTGYYTKTDLVGQVSREDAIKLIDDVINNSGHALVPKYANLFRASGGTDFAGQNNVEGVFNIQYTYLGLKDFNQQNGNRWQVMIGIRGQVLLPYYKGWGFATVNPKLWNAFAADDPRRSNSIISISGENLTSQYSLGDQSQYTGYFCKKYTPLNAGKPEDMGGDFQIDNYDNYVAIRFADVLLMGAELNLTANLSVAQNYYNKVRDRAFQDANHHKTLTSDAAGLQLIMDERRFELALEGQRYWDLLRQGLTVAKQAIDNTGMGTDFNVTFRTETKGLLEIPQTQISLSAGSLKQNPGY